MVLYSCLFRTDVPGVPGRILQRPFFFNVRSLGKIPILSCPFCCGLLLRYYHLVVYIYKLKSWNLDQSLVDFFLNCQNSRLERISPYSIVCIKKSILSFEESCKFTLDLQVSPLSLMTEFHVLDIKTTFNLLLGRPGLHQAGAISSTYHQSLKFRYKGRIVTIQADNEVRLSAEEETVSYRPSLELEEDMLSIEKRR